MDHAQKVDMAAVKPIDREIFELHNMIRKNPQVLQGDLLSMID